MNAKEELLKELKARKYELNNEVKSMLNAGFSEDSMEYKIIYSFLDRINNLITAVENAIFDVPSEEEIEKEHNSFYERGWTGGFKQGCQFILNYKKPESDGK